VFLVVLGPSVIVVVVVYVVLVVLAVLAVWFRVHVDVHRYSHGYFLHNTFYPRVCIVVVDVMFVVTMVTRVAMVTGVMFAVARVTITVTVVVRVTRVT